MIKIIKGIYGHKDSNGNIVSKTIKDAPFSLSPAQEERLVKRGVAEYVDKSIANPKANSGEPEEPKSEISELGYHELKSRAKQIGISGKGTRNELAERIREAEKNMEDKEDLQEEEAVEDGEQPPELSAADPV